MSEKSGDDVANELEGEDLWRNRVVGTGFEAPEDLLANPRNIHVHPLEQHRALLGVLETVGIVQDVVVNRTSGFIVDGHLRVILARRHGHRQIPVKYVELTEREESIVLATFNPLGRLAEVDRTKLAELLEEVERQRDDAQDQASALMQSDEVKELFSTLRALHGITPPSLTGEAREVKGSPRKATVNASKSKLDESKIIYQGREIGHSEEEGECLIELMNTYLDENGLIFGFMTYLMDEGEYAAAG